MSTRVVSLELCVELGACVAPAIPEKLQQLTAPVL